MQAKMKLVPILMGCLISLISVTSYAGNGNNKKPPGQAKKEQGKKAQAPFDAGLSLLVGAGVAYSLKRARDNRTKNNPKEVS